MPDIADHQRVNDGLLARFERPALRRLARAMPPWIGPDSLTVIGVVGAVVAAVGYVASSASAGYLWLAVAGIVINWFGDSLDGTVARLRAIERPAYGFFVDHVCDAICVTLLLLGLGASPYVTFAVACLALIAYLLLTVVVLLRTSVVNEFKITFAGLGPTEARVLLTVLTIGMLVVGQPKSDGLSMYDGVVVALGVIVFGIFAVTAIREAGRLA